MEKFYGSIKLEKENEIISAEEARLLLTEFIEAERKHYLVDFINPLIKGAIKEKQRCIWVEFMELIGNNPKINFDMPSIENELINLGYSVYRDGTFMKISW